jgi:hypothetical protein
MKISLTPVRFRAAARTPRDDQRPGLERRPAQSPQRLYDHRDNHRLDPVQNPGSFRQSAIANVDPGYGRHDQRCRQNETNPGHQETWPSRLPVADMNHHLRRVGARYEIGCAEEVEKLLSGEPLPPTNDLVLHHCDMRGWATKRRGPELEKQQGKLEQALCISGHGAAVHRV